MRCLANLILWNIKYDIKSKDGTQMTIDAAAKHVVFCDVSDPVLCMPNKWPLGSQVTASQEDKIPKVVLEKMKYIETVTYAIEHFREK